MRSVTRNTLDLEAELRYATSDEYVVQMARGELGYIKEGDEVYILLDRPAAQVENPSTTLPADVEDDSFRPLDWKLVAVLVPTGPGIS